MLFGAYAAPASADPAPPDTSASPLSRVLAQAAQVSAEAEVARQETPVARDEREATRDAYKNLTDTEALALAQETFPGLITAPAMHGLPLAPGQEVVDWIDADSALVTTSELGKTALLDSTIPLRDPGPDGSLAPLDLRLTDQDGSFSPQNALVPVSIPESSAGELEFGETGVGVELASPQAADGLLANDRVFYPNVDTDTDAIAVPRPAGAEILWVARSPDAPEMQALNLSLPTGVTVETVSEGSEQLAAMEFFSDGESIGSIRAPSAEDAQGRSVPVSMGLDGSQLEVSFPHASADFAYPLLIDPAFTSDFPDELWEGATNNSDSLYASWDDWAAGWKGYANRAYSNTHWGEYFRYAPSGAFIYMAQFAAVGGDANNSSEFGGIWNPVAGWEPGSWEDRLYGFTGPSIFGKHPNAVRFWGGDHNQQYSTYCARYDCSVDGSPGNVAVHGLQMNGNTGGGKVPVAWSEYAHLYLSDRQVPAVGSLTYAGYVPGTDRWEQSVSASVRVPASVGSGLGMATVGISGVGVSEADDADCSGSHTQPCPLSHEAEFYYDSDGMPEGINTVSAWAHNAAGNASARPSWNVYIDDSAPNTTISGSGWAGPSATLEPGKHPITINATDGVRSGAAADQRSGVDEIAVLVDPVAGAPAEFQPVHVVKQADSGCQGDSCPLQTTFELDTAEWGTASSAPTVTITVGIETTDKVGNTRVDERTITLHNEGETTGTDVTYGFSPGSAGECKLGEGEWEGGCSSPRAYQDLENGEHGFDFR